MKKVNIFFIGIILSMLLFSGLVSSLQGAGIISSVAFETVKEGEEKCVNYGLFNSWDEDVTVQLRIGGELTNILEGGQSENVFLKSGMTKEEAIQTPICFKVGKVYDESCIAGMMCERKCEGQQVSYQGSVSVVNAGSGDGGGGAGSGTELGIKVPLTISVLCESKARSYTPLIIFAAAVVVLIALFIFMRKGKNKGTNQGTNQ